MTVGDLAYDLDLGVVSDPATDLARLNVVSHRHCPCST